MTTLLKNFKQFVIGIGEGIKKFKSYKVGKVK